MFLSRSIVNGGIITTSQIVVLSEWHCSFGLFETKFTYVGRHWFTRINWKQKWAN